MANTRISNLTASAANLAATDVTPVVQTTGVGPVKMTGLQFAGGLLGSTALTGATVTTSQPVLNLSQTWNAGAVTFTGLKFNATDTASASGSLLLDIGTGGGTYVSQFRVTKTGQIRQATDTITRLGPNYAGSTADTCVGDVANFSTTNGFSSIIGLGISTGFFSAPEVRLTRGSGSGTSTPQLQLGAADATNDPVTPAVPQTLQVQSVATNVNNSNRAGYNFTIKGSAGTGTGAGGSLIFQVAPAGSSGTAQNAYATALTIASDKSVTFAGTAIMGTGTVQYLSVNPTGYTNGVVISNLGSNMDIALVAGSSIHWTDSTTNAGSGTTANGVWLWRDAANTLALKNSTNPQIFRAYSTTTGPSYGYFASGVTDAGVATADTLFIGTGGAGAAMTKLALVVNGTTRLDYNSTNASSWTMSTYMWLNGASTSLIGGASGTDALITGSVANDICFRTNSKSILFSNDAGATYALRINSSNLIQFGGTTSSFPALKRISSGNCLQVIAADNTASAGFIVGNQALATTATDGFIYVPTCAGTPTGTPTTQTGTAPIIVDTTNNKLYFYSGGQWRDAGP